MSLGIELVDAPIGAALVAVEAYWKTDRAGLYLMLVAIAGAPSWRHPSYTEIELAMVAAGRAETGWPEAAELAERGEQTSRELGVPFHFASRDRPRDETVRWWDRGRGHPCDDCGLELVQHPAVHWFGMCYSCHVAREDRQPRLRVSLLRDADPHAYDRIWRLVDNALHAARVGWFHAGSRMSGAQSIWFFASDVRRAAEVAIATVRAAGIGHVEIRVASSATDAGAVVWPYGR